MTASRMILQMPKNIVGFFLTYCYIFSAWRLCTAVDVLYFTCTLRYVILILAIIQNNMRVEILAPYTFKIIHWNAPYIPAIYTLISYQMIGDLLYFEWFENQNHFTDWLLKNVFPLKYEVAHHILKYYYGYLIINA